MPLTTVSLAAVSVGEMVAAAITHPREAGGAPSARIWALGRSDHESDRRECESSQPV
jgi:hypothetical protein